MFLFLSVFAASIDGFVSGIVAGTAGIKMTVKTCIKVFGIIFLCCMAASLPGAGFDFSYAERYINLLGVFIMFYLCIKCLYTKESENRHTSIYSLAFYTALDASVVCVYLSLEGYNFFAISALAAFLHSILMAAGIKLANLIIKKKREIYTKYISAVMFGFMGLYKLIESL